MNAIFTKSMARNVFYGGSLFFFLLFLALSFQTERVLPTRDNRHNITAEVTAGKHIWETRNCVGCHSLLGEGAYFAPELGNVYVRRGGDFIKVWMKAMPTAVSPSAAAFTGAMPDLVYWLMFLCRLLRNSKPFSSPRRCTVVARKT